MVKKMGKIQLGLLYNFRTIIYLESQLYPFEYKI